MSETLSQTMWMALFEIADHGSTEANANTHNALVKRGLIEHYAGGRYRPTVLGRKMIARVVAFDVS